MDAGGVPFPESYFNYSEQSEIDVQLYLLCYLMFAGFKGLTGFRVCDLSSVLAAEAAPGFAQNACLQFVQRYEYGDTRRSGQNTGILRYAQDDGSLKDVFLCKAAVPLTQLGFLTGFFGRL